MKFSCRDLPTYFLLKVEFLKVMARAQMAFKLSIGWE